MTDSSPADSTGTADAIRVTDNPAENRYEAWLGDRVAGFSEYIPLADRLVFTHTIVEPEFEGRGIGSQLVRAELDDARSRGLKVLPKCPFVRAYIKRHPDYQDLVRFDHDRATTEPTAD